MVTIMISSSTYQLTLYRIIVKYYEEMDVEEFFAWFPILDFLQEEEGDEESYLERKDVLFHTFGIGIMKCRNI